MRQFFEYLRETLWRSRLKSCFCVAPVRVGLICLAYIHALVAYIQIVSLSSSVSMLWPVLARLQSELVMGGDPPSASICVLPPATDLAFNVLLIAGLHKRDIVLLRVYCGYALVSIFMSLVVYGLLEAAIAPLYCIAIIVSGIYQIYVLLLVRSLMIEIKMNIADDNKYSYTKDQGVVIIRDVESPTPRPVVLEGYRVLPALPAPDINTSVSTLANINEHRPESPVNSKYSTLNKNGTLRTSTLKSYRTSPYADVSAQRSATLPPHQETAIVHTEHAQRPGAIQSLAGPLNVKPFGSNTDTLKREVVSSSTALTGAADVSKKTDLADNTKTDIVSTDTEDKDKSDKPQKKKWGFFKTSNKEEGSSKNDSGAGPNLSNVASTSDPTKSSENKTESLKKEVVVSKFDSAVKKDSTKVDNVKSEEHKEEAAPKKKRGLFKKATKEDIEEKKEDGKEK